MPSDFFQNYEFLLGYFTETAVSVRSNFFKCTEYTLNLKPPVSCPSIAQLVERWTVVASCLLSIGRRFKSGSKENSILHHETFSERFRIVRNRWFFVLKIPLMTRTSAEKLIEFEGVTSPAAVAEWLRRLTRNQFPSGSVGSNPTDCEIGHVDLYHEVVQV